MLELAQEEHRALPVITTPQTLHWHSASMLQFTFTAERDIGNLTETQSAIYKQAKQQNKK